MGKVFLVLLPVASYSSGPAPHYNQVHPVADGNSSSMTGQALPSTLVNKAMPGVLPHLASGASEQSLEQWDDAATVRVFPWRVSQAIRL
jgi:hypothetical protein